MNPRTQTPGELERRNKFATTHWSLVLEASRRSAPEARDALNRLCELYWYPLYHFVRGQVRTAEEAEDLTQGFFTRLMDKNDLASVDPARGRFRAWLLGSIKHYLANERDREQAQKRGGRAVHFDLDDAEVRFGQAPARSLSPEQAYNRNWAATLLENAMSALWKEYERRGEGLIFEKLKETLLGADETAYQRIAGDVGKTPGAVKTAASRLRDRYGEALREQLIQIVERPEDVEDELRFLLAALEGP